MLKKLFPVEALMETIKRFPQSSILSLFLFLLTVAITNDILDQSDEKTIARLYVLGSFGFFWFGFVKLLSEGRDWSKLIQNALGYAGFVFVAGFVFLKSGQELVWFMAPLAPALLVGIGFAPYSKNNDDLSLWFYNRQTWQGVAIAILAALIWFGGIAGALASIQYLFGLKIHGEIYADIWAFTAFLFGPIYALSWIPQQYKFTEDDCHAPPQLSFMLNWVLAPLVAVYLLILYAYFVKIGLSQELPKGQLAYMITTFGGIGIITYLGGWPLREKGTPLLQAFYKVFFPALLMPVAVMAYAIYLRVDQYGLTEPRIIIIWTTLWMGVLAIAYSIKKWPLRYIPMSLAAVLVINAVGPLNISSLAVSSQFSRLEQALSKNSLIANGKIQKAVQSVSLDDRKNISSTLDFLRQRQKLEILKKYIPDINLEKEKSGIYSRSNISEEIMRTHMGIKYLNSYERSHDNAYEDIYLSSPHKYKVHDVKGYDIILVNERVAFNLKDEDRDQSEKLWSYSYAKAQPSDPAHQIDAYYQNQKLHIGLKNKGVISFDLTNFAREFYEREGTKNQSLMMLEKSENGIRVKILLNNVTLRFESEEGAEKQSAKIRNFGFTAFIGE